MNTPSELTKADIDSAVQTLLGNDSEMISEVVKLCDHYKLSLIDLEAYGESYGDRGEPYWDAERLSEKAA